MNIRDLEYVAAVDRYRHFSQAADACNVSQPSLSAQIKKLEARLGVELFARTNAGVMTTDAGARIAAMARDMIRSAQRISDTAAEYHDPLAAPLRLGIIPTLAAYTLPYISKTIRAASEDVNVVYREQPTEILWNELEERGVDVAMVSGATQLNGYRFTPVFKEPLLLMVAKTHRLANLSSIAAQDIPVEQMLLLTKEHCLRDEALELCGDKNVGIDLPEQLLAANFITMTHFLTEGPACALVPTLAQPTLERVNPEMRFIRIDDPSYARTIGFISREGCPREDILMTLCDYIRANPPANVIAVN